MLRTKMNAQISNRRVLSDLNINSSSPRKVQLPAKAAIEVMEDGPNKRVKGNDGYPVIAQVKILSVPGEVNAATRVAAATTPKPNRIASPQLSSPSSILSPDSPFTAANDSQNTTITLPDSPANERLGEREVRENGDALRLRLSLAIYKVKTGQIDIPLDHLRIKTTSSPQPRLPPRLGANISQRRSPPVTANTTQRRTPLPSIDVQNPSSDDAILSSPPRPYDEAHSRSPGKTATPVLTRHRELLGAAPGTPYGKMRMDVTSSVVKKNAADSLLFLGRSGDGFKRSF